MKSDSYDKSHYWGLHQGHEVPLDSHVPQLQGQEPKDIVKMIKTTVWDPKCKYLHPSESVEASSSNEGMPQKFDTPSEADIMAEFSSGYAHSRGENKHFKCYQAHRSIPY